MTQNDFLLHALIVVLAIALFAFMLFMIRTRRQNYQVRVPAHATGKKQKKEMRRELTLDDVL